MPPVEPAELEEEVVAEVEMINTEQVEPSTLPADLQQRLSALASRTGMTPRELIQYAIERCVDDLESHPLEVELIAGYRANYAMNLDMTKEFAHAGVEDF